MGTLLDTSTVELCEQILDDLQHDEYLHCEDNSYGLDIRYVGNNEYEFNNELILNIKQAMYVLYGVGFVTAIYKRLY